jgi:beta-glucosidase
VVASIQVMNVGNRAAVAVPQLYVAFPRASGEPPWQLKGYEKLALAPHESRRVVFHIDRSDLTIWDGRPVVPDGRYQVAVGSSSRDFARTAGFDLGER